MGRGISWIVHHLAWNLWVLSRLAISSLEYVEADCVETFRVEVNLQETNFGPQNSFTSSSLVIFDAGTSGVLVQNKPPFMNETIILISCSSYMHFV